jgi:hypothetical protein
MADKPLNGNGNVPAVAATDLRLGDFPLGSVQSRAVARFLAVRKSPSTAFLQWKAYWERHTKASEEFFLARDHEPMPGEVLLFSDIQATTGMDVLKWRVQFRCEPVAEGQCFNRGDCLIKVEGGRVYRTWTPAEQNSPWSGSRATWSDVPDSGWTLLTFTLPAVRWRYVEEEALGLDCGRHHPPTVPTILGVTFLGVIDGKHRCRPA